VDRDQSGGKHLLGIDQMTDVGTGEMTAGVTGTSGVNRLAAGDIGSIQEIDPSIGSEGGIMAGEAGGEDAIEHINAKGNAVDQIFRGANPHEIAGFFSGEELIDDLNHGVRFRFGFAD